ILASFSDFEQFAKDIKELMNWQIDVLSTVKAVNKAVDKIRDNFYLISVENTPLKKQAKR
ncbi:13785_t:CDS:2, partial [Dentiscutata heterogama]